MHTESLCVMTVMVVIQRLSCLIWFYYLFCCCKLSVDSDIDALAVACLERVAEHRVEALGHQAVADIVRMEHIARAGKSSVIAVGLAAVDEIDILVSVGDRIAVGAADNVAALEHFVLMPRVCLAYHNNRKIGMCLADGAEKGLVCASEIVGTLGIVVIIVNKDRHILLCYEFSHLRLAESRAGKAEIDEVGIDPARGVCDEVT